MAVGWAPAQATPILTLKSGATTVTITDEGPGDLQSGTLGAITFSGSVGGWDLNVTTGLAGFLSGPYPHMDLNSVDVTLAGADPLEIWFSEIGFGPTIALQTDIGGTAAGTLSYELFVDPGNAANTLTTSVAALGPFGPGAFSGSALGGVHLPAPYSVTMTVTLSGMSEEGGVTSFDAEVQPVPEPLSLLLLGSGLLGLGALKRRREI